MEATTAWHRVEVSEAHSVDSHADGPRREAWEAEPEERPRPLPCTVTLADPLEGRLAAVMMLREA